MSFSELFESGFTKRNEDHFAAIVRVAMSDGVITDNEKAFLDRLATRLDITEIEYKAILKDYKSHPINPPTSYNARLERLFDLARMVWADDIEGPNQHQLLDGTHPSQQRLIFEELLAHHFSLLRLRQEMQSHKSIPLSFIEDVETALLEPLPFTLTGAQQHVANEIKSDIAKPYPMLRLVQGDVGSGKTIVAAMAAAQTVGNHYQVALMAPTEILAEQHWVNFKQWFESQGISMTWLSGKTKGKQRTEALARIASGEASIVIGTHALFQPEVQFHKLALVVIDEQHRFGVAQRSKLWKKNLLPPHQLVMTATPIPRTLALTFYGDLDVSVIDEMPPGRKEIKTIHRFDNSRMKIFGFLEEEIKKGRQVYVVYPLIQESEAMDYKDLMDGYESVSREFPSPKYQISIVHGKMKPADKEYEMQRFVKGETQIMVATTVIEVGVNVPNASVMIIESSERFGLSQLHQLRGRVGRGADQSYCILLSSFKLSAEAKTRLKTMVETTDGFKIAEVDLKLRGPGNLMGTQQSGVLNLKIADVVKDTQILVSARNTAIEVLQEDPNLSKEENLPIKKFMFI